MEPENGGLEHEFPNLNWVMFRFHVNFSRGSACLNFLYTMQLRLSCLKITHYFHIELPKNGRIRASPQQQNIYIYTYIYIHIIHLEGTFIIYEGWEPNQRATIQKFAHGMKSKRNSSLSGKNSLKMQSARPSGPKLDYYYVFFLYIFF